MIIETNLPNRLHKGKVRDTYDLGDGHLLMIATDRISAFDVVLPTGIPGKGEVLARMSAFWFRHTTNLMDNHLVGMADAPEVIEKYKGNATFSLVSQEISQQSMVVRKAQRIDIECIVRGYLAGSAWAEYRRNGTVWGKELPEGLKEGQALPEPLFTPTTKAEEGHDQNMTHQEVVDMVGENLARQLEESSLSIYSFANDFARQRGIILADTKMEFGIVDGNLILIDELLTPDSSRFWDASGYEPGRSLPNFDKQYVRDWLDAHGWDREPPAPSLPEDVVRKTSERYIEAYHLLTGEELPKA
ncbi:MAG: phosphoribosylaminoimidazolesuccinocarboxamide synthase [Dehalococcoidia bacterium]|nr:phosphoribosylaminoimidazolesuccinocarboxamide synthase [Dehalococcoidia bacterium]